MEKSILILKKLFWILIVSISVGANAANVQANTADISENLNLEAIASLFAEAKDLESFEKLLNDPALQISNLDLNRDGNVDYLRVVESYEGSLHLIVLQAVLGKDMFQDVATIEADKDTNGREIVQIIGDPYIYGPDYVIEPVYDQRPPIFLFFWAHAVYHAYFSPYYWGYYPPYFHHWHPRPPYFYHRYIHNHINHHYVYNRAKRRRTPLSQELHKKVKRNDYAIKHPEQSYVNRPTAKPSVKPAIKPGTKPNTATKPAAKPAVRPKPMPKPAKKPVSSTRPAKKPRPTPKPAARPKPMPRPAMKPKPMPKPAVRPNPVKRPMPKPAVRPRPMAKPMPKPAVRPRPMMKANTAASMR